VNGLGVSRLGIIDPDIIYPHNLGEMSNVTEGDLGLQKASVMATNLELRTGAEIDAVADSVLSLPALIAVKPADLLFSWVDNSTARLAVAILAKLFLKPVADIGTGIFYEETGQRRRRMGADIRLILPDRCLICSGGIADFNQARDELLNPALHSSQLRDWRLQRAGSLRSLNTVAAGMALRLLEDLIDRRISSSVWLRLEYNPAGIPSIQEIPLPQRRECRICRTLTGAGDDGITLIPEALAER
jgi:molybdopterin/thiamine biosynthesis adenylyltransferase